MAIWLGKQYLDQCEPMEVRRLEFELQKFESKLNEQEQEADLDNSLLDALSSAAVEVWGGGNDGGTSDGQAEKENIIAEKLNSLRIDIPDWVPKVGGKKLGFNIPTWTPGQIPYLATGAVIPPNREFMAVLGDQKHGNNIEAPESLLRKIVREEAKGNQSGGGNYRFTANLNRRVIFDEIIEEAKLRQTVSGRNPFEMA